MCQMRGLAEIGKWFMRRNAAWLAKPLTGI